MTYDVQRTGDRRSPVRRARRAGAVLTIALLAAACSGSPSSTNAAGPGTSSSGPVVTGPGPSGGGSASSAGLAKGVAYAECMRAHGVPDFPDPSAGGGWALPASLNPGSSQYQAATAACGQPPNLGGGAPPPALTTAQERQYLNWAQCIRTHGVPGFKDPAFVDGHAQITTSGSDGAQLAAAQQDCAGDLRGIPGGGGTTTGGSQ
jgi:hypothetical protein